MTARVRELEGRLIRAQSAVECLAVLLELAQMHAVAHRNREALRCAREALNIARARGDGSSAAKALAITARCHYGRGDFVAAVSAGLDAVDAYGIHDLSGRSAALRQVSLAFLAVEAYELAELMAERATADAAKEGDDAGEACARSVWGQILQHADRFDDARRKFREAGAIQRRLGETLSLKKSAIHIGHGYRDQGNDAMRARQRERARMLWRHAVRVYRVALATGSSVAEDAMAWAAIAECECHLEEPEAALTAIRAGLELAVQSASPVTLAHCHLWESHALKALGRIEPARRAIESARNAAEQLDHDAILAECLHAESALNDLAGRFESAHDLEARAAQVMLERTAFVSRVREELRLLAAHHTEAAAGIAPRAAAC